MYTLFFYGRIESRGFPQILLGSFNLLRFVRDVMVSVMMIRTLAIKKKTVITIIMMISIIIIIIIMIMIILIIINNNDNNDNTNSNNVRNINNND